VSEPTLSAVVVCYKDAPAIAAMHARLTGVFAGLGVDYEIIFVNDASPDGADRVLAELVAGDRRVLAVEHSRNFGAQNAFVSGMQLARGDAVILLDGDLQDPPEVIVAFYAKWREGNEVVYGRRVKREGSALLSLFAPIFYRVFRSVAAVPIPLDAGDFALLDRRVVDELLAFPETDQFLRGLRAFVGFRQTGVDYVRPRRPFGHSNHNLLKNLWWARKGIFSFTFLPLEVLGYAAALMTAASFCAVAYQVLDWLRRPEVAHGTSWIVVLILFFGSLQLLAIALVGQYVIQIVEETKRRPKFIRRAIRHGGEHLVRAADIDEFVRSRARAAARTPAPSVGPGDGHGE
jgi:glycosyltransferase involved in cell wall biosynthesis